MSTRRPFGHIVLSAVAAVGLIGLANAAPDEPTLPESWTSDLDWRSIGPANMSGRITALAELYRREIAMDERQPKTVLDKMADVAEILGGEWIGGRNFKQTNKTDGLAGFVVAALDAAEDRLGAPAEA